MLVFIPRYDSWRRSSLFPTNYDQCPGRSGIFEAILLPADEKFHPPPDYHVKGWCTLDAMASSIFITVPVSRYQDYLVTWKLPHCFDHEGHVYCLVERLRSSRLGKHV